MPNFIASSLLEPDYPFFGNEVSFLWTASSKFEKLIFTKCQGCEFFLIIKQTDSGNKFVVKGEKLTRPVNLNVLHHCLNEYIKASVASVEHSNIGFKPHKVLKKNEFILNGDEFLDLISKADFKTIFIEIGFGSGRHLLYQAKNHPDTLIIGIEVYKPSLEQVNNLALKMGLKNLILLNLDARLVLSLLHSNSVDRVFLHFPVPWSKSEKRRVVSRSFAKEIQRILKVGAKFELRSDDRGYVDFSISHFLDLQQGEISIFKNRFLEVSSKYEDRWVSQNKDIYDVIFTNLKHSEKLDLNAGKDTFCFGKLDEKLIEQNFRNYTINGGDFFIHFERMYKKDGGGLLLKVAFGSFDRPEHCYILIENGLGNYFIRKPLLSVENIKAHRILKETLQCQAS